MTDRIEIGKVCEKGPHVSFIGELDHGTCGAHYYATIYVSVEEHGTLREGISITAEEVAAQLSKIVADAEEHMWCEK